MKRHLRAIYWSLKKRIAPDVCSSQIEYRERLLCHLRTAPRWLDLGCGHQFLPDWAWKPDAELLGRLPRLVGTDSDRASLRQHAFLKDRVQSDIGSLPFRSGSFDLVTANMVMEHVDRPERVLSEVRRVLAPGGAFILHTPNRSSPLISVAAHIPQSPKNWLISLLEDRHEDDVYPAVYQCNTGPAVARLGACAGFQMESCEFVVSEAVTQIFGPLAIFELLYIRMTQWKSLANLRPDIIAVFRAEAQKPASMAATAGR